MIHSAINQAHQVKQVLRLAQARGLDRLDAQMLLLKTLGRDLHDRAWLITHDEHPLTPEQKMIFDALLERRLSGEPIAYLTGEKEFFGLTLQIDRRVLDPRPDTEILVEWALELLPVDVSANVADLGTGSGAIGLALKSQRPRASVLAVDISPEALEVAKANSVRLGLEVEFLQSSWEIDKGDKSMDPFDLIVSNPPYIRQNDPHLAELTHEPQLALTSGKDGLEAISAIIESAAQNLRSGGWLLLEHGWDQAEAVKELLRRAGCWQEISSRCDLSGNWRCTGSALVQSKENP